MFDGHYKEKEASIIPVPNISFRVFESMMHAIYTSKFLLLVVLRMLPGPCHSSLRPMTQATSLL